MHSGTRRFARLVGVLALLLGLQLTGRSESVLTGRSESVLTGRAASVLTGQSVRAQAMADQADLAAYVDPFIGTGPAPTASYGQEFDGGDVFPGAAYPTGMLAWSPDTAEHSLP